MVLVNIINNFNTKTCGFGTFHHELLMEYHDIFSLDDNELGCTSQVKHNIKVTDDEPFKE